MNRTPLLTALAVALAGLRLSAQTADTADQTVKLSPFEVSSSNSEGYGSTESITGSRVRTNTKDLPFNVSVVMPQFIKDFDLVEFDDMLAFTSSFAPSMLTPAAGTLRGMTSNLALRDGLRTYTLVSQSELDRIEVIKGPYAAIYGQTQPGGLINYITKEASAKEAESIVIDRGTFNYRRAMLSLTGPILKGKLFYRLDLGYFNKNGSQFGRSMVQREYSGAIKYQFSPDTSASIEYSGMENIRNRGAPQLWIRDPVTLQYVGKLSEPYYFNRTGPGGLGGVFFDWKTQTVYGHFDHQFNDIFSMRVTGNTWTRTQPSRAISGNAYVNEGSTTVANTNMTLGTISRKGQQVVADLVANYHTGPVAQTTLLSFTSSYESEHDTTRGLTTAEINNPSVFSTTLNINDPVWVYPLDPSAYSVLSADRIAQLTINGIFLSQRMDFFNGKLKVFAGGREDKTKNVLIDHLTGSHTTLDASAFTPQLGLNYAITSEVSFYASYSQSYVPQTQAQTTTQAVLPNEKGKGYDAGFKTSLLDSKLNVTAGVYSIIRSNVLQTVIDPTTGQSQLVAAGQVRSDGVELDLNYQATRNIQIITGAGYVNSRLTENPGAIWLIGTHPLGVPAYNFGTAAVYTFKNGPVSGLSLRAEVTGQGKSLGENGAGPYTRNGITYADDGRDNIFMPGWAIVGVGAGYTFRTNGNRFVHSFTINLKNLANRRYVISNWYPEDGFSLSVGYSLRH